MTTPTRAQLQRTVEAVQPGLRNGNGHGHRPPRKRWKRRRDWGGAFAKLLCTLFAVVGVVPLGLGMLTRLPSVQQWAATETRNLLRDQIGVAASYKLRLTPWPLQVAMDDVVIDASDGGRPVLEARRVMARPRLFSLLAGKLDLGQVEIEEPHVRVVLRDGKLANLEYRLPEANRSSKGGEIPLSAVSLTNGVLDISIDDMRIRAREVDVDLTNEGEPIELSLRAGTTYLDHRHDDPVAGRGEMVDEDALCRLELRARVAPDSLLVRRLRAHGAVDFDPAPGTRPPCELPEGDWRRAEVRLESFELKTREGELKRLHGRVAARAPTALLHRFVALPAVTGWVGVDLDAHFDETMQMPQLEGTLEGDQLGIDGRMIARALKAKVETSSKLVHVHDLELGWSGGRVHVAEADIRPFDDGAPLEARGIDIDGIQFADMMADLDVHPHTHVGWHLVKTRVPTFGGTLDPISLSGPITVDSRDFAIFDKPTTDPARQTLMAVSQAKVSGTFNVKPHAIVLSGFQVVTPGSQVRATVSLGFDEQLGLHVHEGSTVDLRDISPLVGIPLAGVARVKAEGSGAFADPRIDGDAKIQGFDFGGFPIGDVQQAQVHFRPLVLELRDALVTHGKSSIAVPTMSLDFDAVGAHAGSDVVMTARADTTRGALTMHDFFEMVKLDQDPRWQDFAGVANGTADIDFVLGGRADRCGEGRLQVRSRMALSKVQMFGEHYDSGDVDMELLWDDIAAGDRGMSVDVRSGVLRKGSGTLVARAAIRHGAKLNADVTGSRIPVDQMSFYNALLGTPTREGAQQEVRPEATFSFVAAVGGTLDRLQGQADVEVSQVRIGPSILPPSQVHLDIVPTAVAARAVARTRCGNEVMAPFDRARYDSDPSDGVFRVNGTLFGGQVRFSDVEMTQQRSQMFSGSFDMHALDLGALANMLPDVAFSASPPRGKLSASVVVHELPADNPALAEVQLTVKKLELERYGHKLRVDQVEEPLVLSGDALRIPTMPLNLQLSSGLRARLVGGGKVEHLSKSPTVSASLDLPATDLSRLGVEIENLKRAEGTVRANLALSGAARAPQLSGSIKLDDGALRIKGVPLPLDDIDVSMRIADSEVIIERATAKAGANGLLSLNGRLPLDGLQLAGGNATLVAKDVKLPVADGVRVTANAMLNASYTPGLGSQRALPQVTGTVSLTSFNYTRPMSFTLDLDQLTGRAPTRVDSYDPEDDFVSFDVNLVSPAPLRLQNNLVDMRLEVRPPGVRLVGTNQRFGARGRLGVETGSKLFLQGHTFVVNEGRVDFEDETKVAPKLDVHATTEYRRYASAANASTTSATDAGASTSGTWRISMHAYGDTDAPKVRFTSDPPLSQDDIVLLLQVGMTRAELDRGLAGSLAQTVGLEALSAVTGLDQAVRKTVPLIDEFRVSSQYSSRSGRPEPAVSIGKRITDNVRATVTSGLSENREVRSNIEWKLNRGVSLQGLYDNVNDVGSSGLGNVGADLRWRLEFE
jgi:translocation and assembly module TamB